jgi:predicted RNA-binding Zn ribbon-like protein
VVRNIGTLELAGNVLCLDFANSVNSRVHLMHDYIASYADLLDWSGHAESLPPQAIRYLRPQAGSAPAASVVTEAHELRDTIYAVFSAFAHSQPPPSTAVHALSEAFRSAMSRATIARDAPGTYEITWRADTSSAIAAPLWPVSHSAGELLLSESLERLGECPGCGWLFLDTSRNGSRRWCSMATCGSRDKMARYHRQQRSSEVD